LQSNSQHYLTTFCDSINRLVRVTRRSESDTTMSDSKAAPQITFTTRLNIQDWDPTLKAWRCPALAIPKADIEDLFVDGDRVDKAKYEVLRGPLAIRWIAADPPTGAVAQVQLGEELSLESETSRWKKLAVIVPFVASIVAAFIGAAATYLSKSGSDGPNKADLVTAHFSDWNIDKRGQFIAYRLTVKAFDLAEYVKTLDTDRYKLIVGIRPRIGISDTEGKYDYALPFPFENTLTMTPPISDNLRQTVAKGCVSLILFRVSATGLARIPFTTPFFPSHYGSEIKMLDSEYDGAC
jgi:hypothetical protein